MSAPDEFDPEAFSDGEPDPEFDPEAFSDGEPDPEFDPEAFVAGTDVPMEFSAMDLTEEALRPKTSLAPELEGLARSSPGTAAGGLITGATLGFDDEIAGLARASQLANAKGGWRGALYELAMRSTPITAFGSIANDMAEAAARIANFASGERNWEGEDGTEETTPLTLEGLLAAYREGRGERRAMNAASEDENPKLWLGSNIAGGAALPGAAATKANSILGAAKITGRAGAGMGLASGLGATEADLTKGEVGEAAAGTAVGGIVGGALGAAGGAGGQYASRAFARMASRSAEDAALLAINNAGISDRMAKLGFDSQEARRGFARVLLSQGFVRAGDTAESILTRSRAFLDDYGSQIGAIIQRADDTGVPSSFEEAANAVLGSLQGRLSIEDAASGPTRELASRLMMQSREAPNTGVPTTFDQLRKTKTRAQDAVNWGNESNLAQELYKDGTTALRDNTLQQLERVVGPDDVDELRRLNASFGVAADLEELVSNKASREAQKGNVGMKEMAAGHLAAGAVGGGFQGGIVGQAVQNALGAIKPKWQSTKARAWDASRNQLYTPVSRVVRGGALEVSRKSAEIMSRPRDQQIEDAVEAFSDAP